MDILSVNFALVPDYTFKVEYKVNHWRHVDLEYTKNLDKLEFGLFDTLRIKMPNYDHSNKTICFSNDNISQVSILNVEKLVNQCFAIYGIDTSFESKGLFDENDRIDIGNGQWSGRMWTKKEHIPGAMILLSKTRIELIIWYTVLIY